MTMRIIDAQVHIWASGTPSGDHRQVSSFTVDELLAEMAEAGVDGAVIHTGYTADLDAGTITAVNEQFFSVEIAKGVVVEVERNAIASKQAA